MGIGPGVVPGYFYGKIRLYALAISLQGEKNAITKAKTFS